MEEQDIYKLFNEVRFDQSEFEQMETEIPEILKKKIKRNLNKEIRQRSYLKLAQKGSITAAVLLAGVIVAGTVSPVLAGNIPLINSISQMLNDKFGGRGEYAAYSQLVDKSVTDSGVTVTINEALADDSKLIIGYTIKSSSKIKNLEVVGLPRFLRVNGSTVGGGRGTGQYLDDTTFVGSDQISYHSSSSADQVKVDLNIDEIMGIKGKWDFAFTVSKAELAKNSTVFAPNQQVDLPDCIVKVDKVVFSPIESTIQFSGNDKNSEKIEENEAMNSHYSWIVFDDQEKELIAKGGSWGGNANLPSGRDFKGEAQFEKVKSIPKYLTVIPCKVTPTGGGYVSTDQNGREVTGTVKTKDPGESIKTIKGNYPLELSQGKMGRLIIKDLKTENGETVVRYTAEGKAPYYQGSSLQIKDSAGEYVTPKSYEIRRDEEHPNDFTMVFPALDLNKEFSLSTTRFEHIEFMEDLKFKVELNQ